MEYSIFLDFYERVGAGKRSLIDHRLFREIKYYPYQLINTIQKT